LNKLENNHIPYRPDIDGLRAIAIVPEITLHAFSRLLPAGFIGLAISTQ
jgi:peptidoglycan/LPS O-acetylase OafA/YrhL